MAKKLRVWTCTDHKGHYPVGVASVVVAENLDEANRLLMVALEDQGLGGESFRLCELDLTTARAHILHDGNY